jgi:hypothetical protein
MIPKLITLVLMPRNPFLYGAVRAGFIMKIPVAGFNGIVVITWDDVVMMMKGKSNDGEQCEDTLPR